MYYLDAHWNSHPLPEELKIIQENSKSNEVIIIDDFQVPYRDFQYDINSETGMPYNFQWINNILDNRWGYFYKSEGDRDQYGYWGPGKPTGQIIFYHKNLNLDKLIKYENGIPYSNI